MSVTKQSKATDGVLALLAGMDPHGEVPAGAVVLMAELLQELREWAVETRQGVEYRTWAQSVTDQMAEVIEERIAPHAESLVRSLT